MTPNDDHKKADWPTPGPNEPVPAWPEYEQLRDAVHDYLDHEPEDPAWTDIWRAFGAIMGEYQRDAFVQAFDVDEPAETACVRRLITGEDECPHSPLEADDDPTGPPHRPPASDHHTLWLDGDILLAVNGEASPTRGIQLGRFQSE